MDLDSSKNFQLQSSILFVIGCYIKQELYIQVNSKSWFTEEWFRTRYQAQLLNRMVRTGTLLNTKQFTQETMRLWSEHYNKDTVV
jgi:hypothetical protein